MRRSKNGWGAALLTLLAIGAWIWAAAVAQWAGELAAGAEAYWSEAGVSPAQVDKAQRRAMEDGRSELPALALWREERDMWVRDGERQAKGGVLYLYGDGALVWPARFLHGGYPPAGDGERAAISSALADALWGGTEVVGRAVTLEGRTYHISGVFQGGEPLLLAQDAGDSETLYDHMVLLPSPGGMDSGEAILNGYGFPWTKLTDYPFYAWALTTLAFLPGLLLGLRLLLRLLRRGGLLRHSPELLAQYALPALGGMGLVLWAMGPGTEIPGRVIPTRWSDFSFWTQLAGELMDEVGSIFTRVLSLREMRFWGMAALCVLLSLGALAFTALWCERVRPDSLTEWWIGCALSLGCVYLFALSTLGVGGLLVPRGLWLLPGLTITGEFCLLRHEKSLYANQTGREKHEEVFYEELEETLRNG